jgi:hypothetical protein
MPALGGSSEGAYPRTDGRLPLERFRAMAMVPGFIHGSGGALLVRAAFGCVWLAQCPESRANFL